LPLLYVALDHGAPIESNARCSALRHEHTIELSYPSRRDTEQFRHVHHPEE
jgi:hypothetical protein